MEQAERFNKLVHTWSRAYQTTLKTKKQKEGRLNELLTWDKPREDNKLEWEAKTIALKNLLHEND